MTSTRDRILDAALAILTAEGMGRVTARRVATEVGLSPMAMYRHFATKDALLDAVAEVAFDRLASEWAEAAPPACQEKALHQQLQLFLDLALARPHLFDFMFLLPRKHGRRYPDQFERGESPTFALVQEAVRAGPIKPGVSDAEILEVTFCAVAQLQGLIQLHRGGRIDLSLPELRALCERAAFRTLGAIYE